MITFKVLRAARFLLHLKLLINMDYISIRVVFNNQTSGESRHVH